MAIKRSEACYKGDKISLAFPHRSYSYTSQIMNEIFATKFVKPAMIPGTNSDRTHKCYAYTVKQAWQNEKLLMCCKSKQTLEEKQPEKKQIGKYTEMNYSQDSADMEPTPLPAHHFLCIHHPNCPERLSPQLLSHRSLSGETANPSQKLEWAATLFSSFYTCCAFSYSHLNCTELKF